jgi:signal transduction histidine kinase
LQVLSLLINMARYGTPFTADALQMPLVMGPLFLLAWGFGLARRFDQLISHYQTLNESLQSQVESKTGELLKLFASMQQKDRQKTLADERARLMQEMHDGLGARVTAALHILRREQVAPAAAAALDEALTDMRLIMDALEPNDGDLATILGNLRYRLEPRLQAAGLQLVWDVEPLEQPVELTASDVLHLQRIVEEALTNALKHSGSDRVVLSLRHDQQAGTADIGVQDFGGPLADVIALNTRVARQGHGVANMTARAERIGAVIDFHRNEFGTLVLLKLPTKKL